MRPSARIAYEVVAAGAGYAAARACRGRTEYVGADGYWVRDPRHVSSPFASIEDARRACDEMAGQEVTR